VKLVFIGSGSAFTVGSDNYQSNMYLEDDEHKKLLLDCGSDAKNALFELGLSYKDIDGVYISHLHADHVGGLEWLSFTTYFDKNCPKPTLFICEKLKNELWKNVLSGGLRSLQGIEPKLSSFFKVKTVKENDHFEWSGVDFKIIQTIHVMNEFTINPSYGLFFTANGVNVFLTTDTQFCPHQIKEFYNQADIIFQDCETSKYLSGVHAHYTELLTLSPEVKSKMWLYHYNPGPLPDPKKDGFRGFVKKAQVFDFRKPETLV
jgi:ribonuclease BN (tRNA processing enzyme)